MFKTARQMLFPLTVLTMSITTTSQALAEQLLPDIARTATEEIGAGLQGCGLSLVDPNTPGMPYPRRDARYAVVNQQGRVLAYFLQVYRNGADWLWMNPDGSYQHSIRFTNSQIQFSTPWSGVVASSNRYMTVGGPGYNFYCRAQGGMIPNLDFFMHCVRRDFVNFITGQLCRHSTPDAP